MKMMCSKKHDVPEFIKSLSLSFGAKQLKAFLFMKRNVIKWYDTLSTDERSRIKQYLQTN